MSNPSLRIARAGKEIDVHLLEEVRRRLADGQLLPTDHYWTPGMAAWATLAELPGPVRQLPFPRPLEKEAGFIDGILACKVFVPLCSWGSEDGSLGAVGRFTLITAESSAVDNVLLEWVLALELHRQGRVKKVVPLLFGDAARNGGFSPFPFDRLSQVPDIVAEPTVRKARAYLEDAGLEVSPDFESQTVRGVVSAVLEFQGVKMHELGVKEVAIAAVAKGLLEEVGK